MHMRSSMLSMTRCGCRLLTTSRPMTKRFSGKRSVTFVPSSKLSMSSGNRDGVGMTRCHSPTGMLLLDLPVVCFVRSLFLTCRSMCLSCVRKPTAKRSALPQGLMVSAETTWYKQMLIPCKAWSTCTSGPNVMAAGPPSF